MVVGVFSFWYSFLFWIGSAAAAVVAVGLGVGAYNRLYSIGNLSCMYLPK